MSDIDRLLGGSGPTGRLGSRSDHPTGSRVYPATAALLRAVAVSNHGSPAWYCDCAVCAAALDLADTILGVSDE